MNRKILLTFLFALVAQLVLAQVKVSGKVIDENNDPVPFANVIFQNSTIGTVSDENGVFYLESDKFYPKIEVSFLGFEMTTVDLKSENYNISIVLKEERSSLREVTIYSGRIKNKGNPAVDILKKIWKKKRKNGLNLYNAYEYDKYEKIEFDLNNIDDKLTSNKVFKGMEFIFDQVDTSSITGKSYLPIFINESAYKTYGKNTIPKKHHEKLLGNKNSGFSNNQGLISFVKQLYVDYDVYDNYVKFFDKSFASPLSKLGPQVYNYVLSDSAFIDDKWCYNIVFYPRRKNELTFKGDFWVNDTTFAVKEIEMYAVKSANINWVKDIYIKQEFNVLNDSVFLLKRDHFMSDFSLNKKDASKGVYGRRTTLYDNHVFNVNRPEEYYKKAVSQDQDLYNQSNDFWQTNRQEALSKDEIGIYKMLDTLQTVRRFKELNSAADVLITGYWPAANGLELGPIWSFFGYNEIEGFRVRLGGRTYFTPNDQWRLKGYLAYGFKDSKFKYGIEGRWLLDKKSRLTASIGTRKDVEQLGVSLTTSNDVLDKSIASTSIFTRGDNAFLSSVNIGNVKVSAEPVKNLEVRLGATYKVLESANPEAFKVDFIDKNGNIQSHINQTDLSVAFQYTPKRKPWGFGVDQGTSNKGRYPILFFSFTKGVEGVFNSDFEYNKLQFYYEQPFQIGLLGQTRSYFEIGKTFDPVPVQLLNVVPGNQTYFIGRRVFDLLDYYEFVTDEYAALHLEHNFNGRLFSKFPLLRKLQWREIVGVRGVVGSISDESIAINASSIEYKAPEDLYWEYHFGVGNIMKLFRIDFVFRGNYKDVPNATNFAVKGGIGFYF